MRVTKMVTDGVTDMTTKNKIILGNIRDREKANLIIRKGIFLKTKDGSL